MIVPPSSQSHISGSTSSVASEFEQGCTNRLPSVTGGERFDGCGSGGDECGAAGNYKPPAGASNSLQQSGISWTETRSSGFKIYYNASCDVSKTENVAGLKCSLAASLH